MASTILTPTAVTREALRILHQKLNFIGTIDRQYDDQFAKSGAKIGDSLKIRMPNEYTVRTGKTIDVQDTVETSQTLTVSTQAGTDITFSSAELALSLDDFSKRILAPAMTKLAAYVEADAMSMYKDVNNAVWTSGSAITYNDVLTGRVQMQASLAPDGDRTANMNPKDMADLVKDTKTLFNSQGEINGQYRNGYMGMAAGFDFVENTLWANHTRGDAASRVCNTSTGITSGTATITVSGGSGTLNKGDIFTIEGVYAVHPESKTVTRDLMQFVATADSTTSVAVYPTPVTSGAKQNVSIVSAGSGKTVTVSGTASGVDTTSMLYHKEAFTFVTADLPLPGGVDFARRDTQDGISMRVVRAYDINNDMFPCRIELLYGYKTIRPSSACRLHFN